MTKEELKKGLNEKQLRFIDEFFKGVNVCVTGSAGTGKSYVIQKLKRYFEKNELPIGITALTGCAAINIGGSTLHSWAGIGLADGTNATVLAQVLRNKKAKNRISGCKALMIDEISMARGDLLDKIDYVFKQVRRNQRPFGGIQIIASGDPYQLPPIFKNEEDGELFFESPSWNRGNFKIIELTDIIRQDKDGEFAKFLNKVRVGEVDTLKILNPCVNRKFPEGQTPVKLYCKNVNVDKENLYQLNKLQGERKVFRAIDWGAPHHTDYFNKSCPAPQVLELKVGARVMLLKNLDVENGYCNGSVGTVTSFSNVGVEVKFQYGRLFVSRESWEIKEQVIKDGKLKTKVIAERQQVPLKLAFACSVHKAMGSTLDCAEVDVSDAFATGHIYVSLSRVKNLESLSVKPFSIDRIKVNPKVTEFYSSIK